MTRTAAPEGDALSLRRFASRPPKVALAAVLTLALLPQASSAVATGPAANDPLLSRQWGLTAIHAVDAWRYSTGRGVIVAVIDTGVDYRHEELRGKVILLRGSNMATHSCPSGPCRDDPWDDGHGTYVAGIIAARRNNGRGIAGVAPDARVLPIVWDGSTDAEAGRPTDIEAAIRFAVDHGAKVINASLGTTSTDVDSGVNYAWGKGALVIGAAGNNSWPDCGYPARSEKALCVGALARDGTKASYSAWGTVDVFAPGGEASICDDGQRAIISTGSPLQLRAGGLETPRGTVDPITVPLPCDTGLPEGYTTAFGTSLASPMVAGVAALLFARGYNNRQVRDRILRFADDLGPSGQDPIYGHGRVNALRALRGR